MAIVTEISWEQVADPAFTPLARQAFRAAVDQVAANAKTVLPACASRIDQDVAIVLAGDVALLEGGTARVASQCQGTTQYRVVNDTIYELQRTLWAFQGLGEVLHPDHHLEGEQRANVSILVSVLAERFSTLLETVMDTELRGRITPANPRTAQRQPVSQKPEKGSAHGTS
jgi:hypothetical protein